MITKAYLGLDLLIFSIPSSPGVFRPSRRAPDRDNSLKRSIAVGMGAQVYGYQGSAMIALAGDRLASVAGRAMLRRGTCRWPRARLAINERSSSDFKNKLLQNSNAKSAARSQNFHHVSSG